MKQSFTFYLTMFVIKLKGLKKIFSEDPVDYKKLRKEDIHQPTGKFFKQKTVRSFTINKTLVTEVKQDVESNKLLLFIHGGAFISGPAQHHWDSIKEIVKHTNHNVWLCDYPKAPEHKISEISKNIDAVYQRALESFEAEQISFIGDSVGATLICALIQRLLTKKLELPHQLFLLSPVMDASISNPAIDEIDKRDPMLSKKGILSGKKMCVEHNDLSNPMISPLHGNFENFPKTILFLAENDITYPDQLLAVEKLKKAAVEIEVIFGENMPHIWPLLPVMKEAKVALHQIIKRLNK